MRNPSIEFYDFGVPEALMLDKSLIVINTDKIG